MDKVNIPLTRQQATALHTFLDSLGKGSHPVSLPRVIQDIKLWIEHLLNVPTQEYPKIVQSLVISETSENHYMIQADSEHDSGANCIMRDGDFEHALLGAIEVLKEAVQFTRDAKEGN